MSPDWVLSTKAGILLNAYVGRSGILTARFLTVYASHIPVTLEWQDSMAVYTLSG